VENPDFIAAILILESVSRLRDRRPRKRGENARECLPKASIRGAELFKMRIADFVGILHKKSGRFFLGKGLKLRFRQNALPEYFAGIFCRKSWGYRHTALLAEVKPNYFLRAARSAALKK
jgi:hypothetical protein